MKRKEMISMCLMDALHGDLFPLMGLIDWLLTEKHLTVTRIMDLGERHFGIPRQTTFDTIKYFQ